MLTRSITRLTKHAVRRTDDWLDSVRGSKHVLIEVRTPMNLAVLAPIWRGLSQDPRLSIAFTALPTPQLTRAFAEAEASHLVLPRDRVAMHRIALYMNADPWDPASLLRCRRRINFFHGVAGKYNLDCPEGLPFNFHFYDRVAFPNAGRLQQYVAAGLVRPERARLVGFPKLDALVNEPGTPAAAASALGLPARRRTAIFAPTFSTASALHHHGEAIVEQLLASDMNVIVKLHDRSLVPDAVYTGGVNWPARFQRFASARGFLFADGGDSTPYLRAADVLVTDHSTIGFEFCALDRPVIVVDAPDLIAAARINPQKVALLRSAADVVTSAAEVPGAIRRALDHPAARRAERSDVVEQVFHDPGRATARALAVSYELLELSPPDGLDARVLEAATAARV